MIMDSLEDERTLEHILRQLGANHFFYDTLEWHLEVWFFVSNYEGKILFLFIFII
jgi:hypothetical protein